MPPFPEPDFEPWREEADRPVELPEAEFLVAMVPLEPAVAPAEPARTGEVSPAGTAAMRTVAPAAASLAPAVAVVAGASLGDAVASRTAPQWGQRPRAVGEPSASR
ncbi:MAG: hypothetical protein NTW19_00860 [Planctomycetota bacterium]|nr:hypothetical protein [Planctomycetota bacterium]